MKSILPYLDLRMILGIAAALALLLWLLESALINELIKIGLSQSGARGEKYRRIRRAGRRKIALCAWRASLGLSTKGRRGALVRASCDAAADAKSEGDMSEREADEWCTKIINQAFTAERAWASAVRSVRLNGTN